MATVVILTAASSSPWATPSDWNAANNSIEAIGGGAGGNPTSIAFSGQAGGGGAYAKIINQALSGNIAFTIGADAASTVDGTDTQFKDSSTLLAKAGLSATGLGGLATTSVGSTKFKGGNGSPGSSGVDPDAGAGGGGGAGGLNAAGNNGANSPGSGNIGGAGGQGDGSAGGAGGAGGNNGAGANGAAGAEWSSAGSGGGGGGCGGENGAGGNGGAYGAGGGGGGIASGAGGTGKAGVIVITYTVAPAITSTVTTQGEDSTAAVVSEELAAAVASATEDSTASTLFEELAAAIASATEDYSDGVFVVTSLGPEYTLLQQRHRRMRIAQARGIGSFFRP